MPRAARFVMRSLFAVWLLILLAFGDESDLYGGSDEPQP